MTRALNKEQRASRLLLSILCVFIVLWLPYNIMALYASRNGFQSIPTWAWSLGYWLCYLNSTVNPACYAACNQVTSRHYLIQNRFVQTFKRTFKDILTGKIFRRKNKWLQFFWLFLLYFFGSTVREEVKIIYVQNTNAQCRSCIWFNRMKKIVELAVAIKFYEVPYVETWPWWCNRSKLIIRP